ncbi:MULTISPECIES: phosphocarrier protein HPr [unclassified Planococcus (in: firmicutes)]|uniref:phosphocarrier protein HPr n=1 Tax=unclassified Planococcus (in: firmicutes) TaxID=2662419 RepID=UPI000C325E94|nr:MULTISPECIES: phosphocarrier protein HPr [unclassified Planococcus (in: firmicutes)]AUD14476.1 phosphocarrier protein HPr [Planococcus sp. MB-3u-03]PKG44751.1 phosphocarrier protein HPr [Planococcus sp. Urea-trap-24]PKG87094.1 phosphocarrier protein HPr [Planococcus sp. Urea-3u-39]PKH41149.1 phosphocarrier protein HPr [Planococcus sp. MB-3u-09]
MIEKTYTIISDEGLHARPASKLVGAVSPFSADVKMLYKEREVNLKSIMGVMSLGVSKGHTIKITADGSDEESLMAKVEELIVAEGLGKV